MKDQTELSLTGEGIPEAVKIKAARIMDLLEEVTSLSVVGEFLRSKNLHHSAGSWAEMREKRIIPSLYARKITLEELNQLLSESEEFGRCHVFLYNAKRKDVENLIDVGKITEICSRLGLSAALNDVIVEDLPAKPKITRIRRETLNGQQTWVFKVVETRSEKKFVGETFQNDTIRKEWKLEQVRAVNVARLHESGLLELRIQSHLNSTRYESDISKLWRILHEFLPPTRFNEFSLRHVKTHFWDHRDSLKEKIRFCDSTMRNDFGTTIVASTGAEEADLFDDKAAAASLDHFLGNGAHCDSSNIWFRPVDNLLSREIHVLICGQSNEFAITANCTKQEYEYVLNELRAHSK